jgi:hypothetical protein
MTPHTSSATYGSRRPTSPGSTSWRTDPTRHGCRRPSPVIACDLLAELTEVTARLSQFGKKSTLQEILSERVRLIKCEQMRRNAT